MCDRTPGVNTVYSKLPPIKTTIVSIDFLAEYQIRKYVASEYSSSKQIDETNFVLVNIYNPNTETE